jgi:hypothetical protein
MCNTYSFQVNLHAGKSTHYIHSAYQELIKGIFIKFCAGEYYKKLSSQLKFERLEVLTVMLLTAEVLWM